MAFGCVFDSQFTREGSRGQITVVLEIVAALANVVPDASSIQQPEVDQKKIHQLFFYPLASKDLKVSIGI